MNLRSDIATDTKKEDCLTLPSQVVEAIQYWMQRLTDIHTLSQCGPEAIERELLAKMYEGKILTHKDPIAREVALCILGNWHYSESLTTLLSWPGIPGYPRNTDDHTA